MENDQPPVPSPRPAPGELDGKTIAILVWLGTIFFGFIPSLVVFLIRKDDEFLLDHTKEALNWSITTAIGWLCGVVFSFLLIGFLFFPLIILCNLVFCIMGAVKASNNQRFRVPVSLRLIK
ncbi:MAG: hypothetical protein H6R07_915 [Proteobacteria bacterium]|nr:hypothetical protein [Pseudomonadota bacterium]